MNDLQTERATLFQQKKAKQEQARLALKEKLVASKAMTTRLLEELEELEGELKITQHICDEYTLLQRGHGASTSKQKKVPSSKSAKRTRRAKRTRIQKKEWMKVLSLLPTSRDAAIPIKNIFADLATVQIDATEQALYLQLVKLEAQGLTARISDNRKNLWFRTENLVNLREAANQ